MTEPLVQLVQSALSATDAARASALSHDVLVLPRRRADDGVGVYSQASVFLVKDLRAAGVDAAYLDPSENREFEVQKSAVLVDLVQLAIGSGGGLISAAAWATLQRFFSRRQQDEASNRELEVTLVDISGSTGRQLRVRGTRDDVLTVIGQLDLPRELAVEDVDLSPSSSPHGEEESAS
jgi:hypothetical protein